jgi:ATP-binding cassette subfamily B protein
LVTYFHHQPRLWYISVPNLTTGKYIELCIGENIGIGNIADIKNRTAIFKAAIIGGALRFIAAFPQNFNTVIASQYARIKDPRICCGLSGGQWQRLALSRSFMRLFSADLLLLDEPSASLDPEAEYNLFKKLKEARRGRTTVYISHRFNTVRAATRIMVFDCP